MHTLATMARTGIRWPFPSRFSATLNQRPGHDLRHGARLCLRTMPKYALPIATNLPASRSFASDKERRPILKSTRSRSGPRPDAESRRQTLEPGGSDPEADESFLDCSYLRKQSSRAYQSESHMAWLKHVSSTSKRQTDEYARARAKERWRADTEYLEQKQLGRAIFSQGNFYNVARNLPETPQARERAIRNFTRLQSNMRSCLGTKVRCTTLTVFAPLGEVNMFWRLGRVMIFLAIWIALSGSLYWPKYLLRRLDVKANGTSL